MSVDFEALRKELNVCLGTDPNGDLCYFSDNRAENCLGFAFRDFGLPRECFNGEKLIREAIRLLEEETRKKAEILEILKKYAAGEKSGGVDADIRTAKEY